MHSPWKGGNAINFYTMKTFEEIFTYDRLLRSFKECRKGQLWKGSVIDFQMNYAEKLMELERELREGTYQALPDNITYIHERGKTRTIHSQHIRDRIVHKIINQDILIPTFHKSFIRQNSASQTNKGVDFAMRTFKCHLNRAYRKWGTDFYILSIDIRKFFENIPHWYIEELLRKKIDDERILHLCMESMRSYGGEKGLGLGSEMNQTYALLCLNEFDHLMKERFHIMEYARYMDDIYLLHNSKEYLNEIKAFTVNYLHDLEMEISPNKTQISPMKNGVNFLGFRWKMTESGHVINTPKKQTITRNKKKLRKLRRIMDEGRIDSKEVENCYASMRGNLMRSSNKSTIINMDKYYNKLFIERWVNEFEQQGNAEIQQSAVCSE